MSALNPVFGGVTPSTNQEAGRGEPEHRQRWLHDLERSWLRSWAQAQPTHPLQEQHDEQAPSARASAATGPEATVHAEPPRRAQGPTVDIPADSSPSAMDLSGRQSAAETPLACFQHAEPAADATLTPTGNASAAVASHTSSQPSTATPLPTSPALVCAPPQHDNRCGVALASRAGAPVAGPAFPAGQPPGPVDSAASLHLRETHANAVMAALRDSRLNDVESQAAARAIAQSLAQAGYARVQVYVNGKARSHHQPGLWSAADARPEPTQSQASTRPPEPPHGHQ